jgi:hypothetical protein
MSFRFRRTIKILPGVRLTIGWGGIGLNIGRRGLSIGFGKRGVRLNVGLPGTGISYSKKISKSYDRLFNSGQSKKHEANSIEPVELDGVEYTLGPHFFEPILTRVNTKKKLSKKAEEKFLKDHSKAIDDYLEETAKKLSRKIVFAGVLHLSPSVRGSREFDRAICAPELPERPKVPIIPSIPEQSYLYFGRRAELSGDRLRRYRKELGSWIKNWREQTKGIESNWGPYSNAHSKTLRCREIAKLKIADDRSYLGEILKARIDRVSWPRNTNIELDVEGYAHTQTVALLVDLPNLDDLPTKIVEKVSGSKRLHLLSLTTKQRLTLSQGWALSTAAALIILVYETDPHIQNVKIFGKMRTSKGADEIVVRPVFTISIDRLTFDWEVGDLFTDEDIGEMANRDWCKLH